METWRFLYSQREWRCGDQTDYQDVPKYKHFSLDLREVIVSFMYPTLWLETTIPTYYQDKNFTNDWYGCYCSKSKINILFLSPKQHQQILFVSFIWTEIYLDLQTQSRLTEHCLEKFICTDLDFPLQFVDFFGNRPTVIEQVSPLWFLLFS